MTILKVNDFSNATQGSFEVLSHFDCLNEFGPYSHLNPIIKSKKQTKTLDTHNTISCNFNYGVQDSGNGVSTTAGQCTTNGARCGAKPPPIHNQTLNRAIV